MVPVPKVFGVEWRAEAKPLLGAGRLLSALLNRVPLTQARPPAAQGGSESSPALPTSGQLPKVMGPASGRTGVHFQNLGES